VELQVKDKALKPKSYEDTPFEFVETEEQLRNLQTELLQVTELAVDLEHHSVRSYQGFTCLMQLSTRTKDYVVDVLKLFAILGKYLLPVFTDPAILKVFHGGDYDIQWLQRDFSIYVVNMFDTGQAARVLNLKSAALSHLLFEFCQVIADKSNQLADWRQRPIPEKMLHYAREDTHYLLFIYD